MSRQWKSARLAALIGAAALVGGMAFGTQVGAAPEPELALGAHVQWMAAGQILVAAAVLLANENLCQLNGNPLLLFIVDLSSFLACSPAVADSVYAFQGKGMPMVCTWAHGLVNLIAFEKVRDQAGTGSIL
jgi:hypothetical protein